MGACAARLLLALAASALTDASPATLRVLHVTDAHLGADAERGDLPLAGNAAMATDGLLHSAISAASQADLSIALWGGDTAPTRCEHCYPYEASDVAAVIGRAAAAFRKALPDGLRVFPVLGNTDVPEQHAKPGGPYADTWADSRADDALRAWLSDGARASLTARGYYADVVDDVWTIVALNTRACHVKNFADFVPPRNGAEHGTGVPHLEEQVAWFRGVLGEARAAGRKVIVAGHVPPGIWGGCWGEFGDAYENTVADFQDVVAAQLFGHQHSGSSRLLRAFAPTDDRTLPGARESSVAFVTPAISPERWHMPTFRIYHLRDASVDSFDQYRLDLERPTNEHGGILWQLSYQAPLHLGLASLAPREWKRVADFAKTNATYRSLLMKLEANGKEWFDGSKSAADYACGINHVGEPAYLKCTGKSQEVAVRDYAKRDHTYVLSAIFPFEAIMRHFCTSLPGLLEEDCDAP